MLFQRICISPLFSLRLQISYAGQEHVSRMHYERGGTVNWGETALMASLRPLPYGVNMDLEIWGSKVGVDRR